MKYNFDVITLKGLEETFAEARKTMSDWEWAHGGYEALYNSNLKRLVKEKEARNQQELKSNKSKK